MKYAFVDRQRTLHPVRKLCSLVGVSPTCFYDWARHRVSNRSIADDALAAKIIQIHAESRRTYGRPRICAKLRSEGFAVGANRVARLMRKANVHGILRRGFCRTTDSNHSDPIAPNTLDRKFNPIAVPRTDHVWVGDVTFIPTRERFLYLAIVLDLASRRVVGCAMGSVNDADLVVRALNSAVETRSPSASTLFHSDRGSTYASNAFRAALAKSEIRQSMSRRANCWDNAVAESFFATLKTELRVAPGNRETKRAWLFTATSTRDTIPSTAFGARLR